MYLSQLAPPPPPFQTSNPSFSSKPHDGDGWAQPGVLLSSLEGLYFQITQGYYEGKIDRQSFSREPLSRDINKQQEKFILLERHRRKN